MFVRYEIPPNWITYDPMAILEELLAAKTGILALTQIPYQRSWADELQKAQLKREVAGTSRIEGAEFTERELEAAMQETPEQFRLDWPTRITETEFFKRVKAMPKGKVHGFLSA